jgi:hypothetical protein
VKPTILWIHVRCQSKSRTAKCTACVASVSQRSRKHSPVNCGLLYEQQIPTSRSYFRGSNIHQQILSLGHGSYHGVNESGRNGDFTFHVLSASTTSYPCFAARFARNPRVFRISCTLSINRYCCSTFDQRPCSDSLHFVFFIISF